MEPSAVHIVPPESRAFYHHVREVALQGFDGIFQRVSFTPFAEKRGVRVVFEIYGSAVAFDNGQLPCGDNAVDHHHIRRAHPDKTFVIADRRTQKVDKRRFENTRNRRVRKSVRLVSLTVRHISVVRSDNPFIVARFLNDLRKIKYAVGYHIALEGVEVDNVPLSLSVK